MLERVEEVGREVLEVKVAMRDTGRPSIMVLDM